MTIWKRPTVVAGAAALAGLAVGATVVGVLAFVDGLEDARSVPFGELGFLDNLGIEVAPYLGDIKEGGGGGERIGGLSATVSLSPLRIDTKDSVSYLVTLFARSVRSALVKASCANCST